MLLENGIIDDIFVLGGDNLKSRGPITNATSLSWHFARFNSYIKDCLYFIGQGREYIGNLFSFEIVIKYLTNCRSTYFLWSTDRAVYPFES